MFKGKPLWKDSRLRQQTMDYDPGSRIKVIGKRELSLFDWQD